MKTPIHLGVDMKDAPVPASPASDGKAFPILYLSGVKGLDKLPAEGKMEVKYKRVRSSTTTDRDGEERGSIDLEIHCICEVEGMEEEKGDKKMKTEDILDALLKQAMEEEESDDSEFEDDED